MPQLKPQDRHVMLVLAAAALELEDLVLDTEHRDDLEIARAEIIKFTKMLAREQTEDGRKRQTEIHLRNIREVLELDQRRDDLASAIQGYGRRIDMDRFKADAGGIFAGTPCLCELSELCRWIDSKVRQHYETETGEVLPPIIYEAHSPVNSGGSGFTDNFHINGATNVRTPTATVVLTFRKHQLDLRTLRQCIYLLFHESICHAYQAPAEQDRRNADDTCDWSDGWMDAMAWQLTLQAIKAPSAECPWISNNRVHTTRDCFELHDRRFRLPLPRLDEADMELRVLARRAFYRLHEHWAGRDMALSEQAEQTILRFSLLLNHACMTVEERAELCSNIASLLLKQKDPAVAARCAHDCREYTVRPNLKVLLTALRRLPLH